MSKNQPLYERIYDQLLLDIRRGVFPPGAQVPTEKQLAATYGVSRITSKRALTRLAEEGFIERIRGRGSFVRHDVGEQITGVSAFKAGAAGALPAVLSPARKTTTIKIGFVAQDLGIAYGMDLFTGIEAALRQMDYGMMVRLTGGCARKEEEAITSMVHHGVDGLIVFPVNGEQYNPALIKLHMHGFPVVLVDRYYRGVDVPAVGTDGESAAYEAVTHLIDLGHRHIALLSPPPEFTVTIEDRIKGYVAAFTDRQMAIDHTLMVTDLTTALPGTPQDDAYAEDRAFLTRFFQNNPQVTAVVTVEYDLARLVQAVADELHRPIPGGLSVVCFDSPLPEAGQQPVFTHIRQDQAAMALRAVEMIRCLIENEGDEGMTRQMLPGELVVGRSTGPVVG